MRGWTKEGKILSKSSIFMCLWKYVCFWNLDYSPSVYTGLLSAILRVFLCGMCKSESRRHTVIVADALYSVCCEDVSGIRGRGVDSWPCANDSRANRLSAFSAKISGAVCSVMAKALLLIRVRKDVGERGCFYSRVPVFMVWYLVYCTLLYTFYILYTHLYPL